MNTTFLTMETKGNISVSPGGHPLIVREGVFVSLPHFSCQLTGNWSIRPTAFGACVPALLIAGLRLSLRNHFGSRDVRIRQNRNCTAKRQRQYSHALRGGSLNSRTTFFALDIRTLAYLARRSISRRSEIY